MLAGLELNVQLTEGKALFHGGNMKVDVLSELKKKKNTHLHRFFLMRSCFCTMFLSPSMTVHFAPKGLFVAPASHVSFSRHVTH